MGGLASTMKNKTVIKGRSKVLLIADLPVVRYGMSQLLLQEPDLEVCGESEDILDAMHKMEATRPDLAAVGLPLDNAGHHGVIQRLKAKYPHLKVLAAIRHDDPHLAGRILHAGADGCIHWGEPLARIVEAIRAVLRGELYVGSRMAKRILHRAMEGQATDGSPVALLSDRELDVFTMIGQGQTTKQIARRLDLSPRTIETHRKKIKLKLGLQNAAQLSRCAFQWVKNEAD